MSRTLFIGSSLTTAFFDWHKERGTDHGYGDADFVMCHGAYWIPARLLPETAFDHVHSRFLFPRSFQVYTSDGKVLNSRFFGSGEEWHHGSQLGIDLASYSRIVFTVPMLFWDVSFRLFHRETGVLSERTAKIFSEAGFGQAISERAFLKIHEDRFGHAYHFLDAVRDCCADLPIHIAPAVLPPARLRQYTKVWRKLHWLEMELVFEELGRRYATVAMRQPRDTLTDDLETKTQFMADEHHHFNADFVQRLFEDNRF